MWLFGIDEVIRSCWGSRRSEGAVLFGIEESSLLIWLFLEDAEGRPEVRHCLFDVFELYSRQRVPELKRVMHID
jgi:hypothetical protein